MTNLEQRLEKAKAAGAAKYGKQYVNFGGNHYRLNVVPTPSLMLDYQLGIGGFPYGHCVEVFGANKLGKSSAIGYGTLANVQKQGKIPALIAVEPRLVTPDDRQWAIDLGLDPEKMVIYYPDNAEEAFDMMRDLILTEEPLVDYIMVDSIGGMGTEASAKEGGKKQAYGNSSTITSGMNDIMPKLYKNDIGLLLINQQRQIGSFKGNTIYESGGGEALKHHARVRIHLKPGKAKYTASLDGENVLVGQELICSFVKNNMAQAQAKKANFEFFHIATDQYGFGVDTAQDMINVGKVTGVIKGSGFLEHPSFPALKNGNHALNGKKAVSEFLAENPEVVEVIRNDVMKVMLENELKAAERKAQLAKKAKVTNA